MADVEPEPQFVSLKDRINALNQQKTTNASSASTTFGKRAPPPLPTSKSSSAGRPPPPARVQTVNNPPIPTYGSAVDRGVDNLPMGKTVLPPPPVERDIIATTPILPALGLKYPPPLPGRKASQPNLPPRIDTRRASTASTVSLPPLDTQQRRLPPALSDIKLPPLDTQQRRLPPALSDIKLPPLDTQQRRLPPTLSDAKLPPLPLTRKEREERAKEMAKDIKIPIPTTKSPPVIPIRLSPTERSVSPPKVPQRPQLPSRTSGTKIEEPQPVRKLPPVAPTRNILSMGFNHKSKAPTPPEEPEPAQKTGKTPPPIPLSSKPTKSQVQAIKDRPPPPPPTECLRCRDFSRPDQLASLHPRETLPASHDITGYLATVLCSPFPSPTDKARAIFTWCHHNIAYDVVAFFGNNVKHHEPSDTIASGVAVCAGYAGVFSAIALKAGLEVVIINGYGKGYGYTPLKPTDPIPTFTSNHAWNAVRIDGGEWKLLDACWGAGNVSAEQTFTKHFEPSLFTMSNEDFGRKHFPSDAAHFYRADYSTVTWEDYCLGPSNGLGEPVTVYDNVCAKLGFDHTSFTPAQKFLSSPANAVMRFQFSNACEHWDHRKHGSKLPPYPMVLRIGGLDGRKTDWVPFETNGYWWWCDVRMRDLGCRGGEVSVYSVETINGKDARGMSKSEFERIRRNAGMSFGALAVWTID